MPSVGNPNGPSKNRLAARASSARKERRKRSQAPKDKVAKADTTRGARPGLLPTSGPRAKVSAKKARKIEKRLAHAMKRKMEAEGEAEMKDAPEVEGEGEKAEEVEMGDIHPTSNLHLQSSLFNLEPTFISILITAPQPTKPIPKSYFFSSGANSHFFSFLLTASSFIFTSTKPQLGALSPFRHNMSTSLSATFVQNMTQRLTEILLLNLMTADFKNHIFYNSNRRLEEAKQKGITLNDISIGDDCLATWAGRTWDPDTASLHDTLQDDALNLLEAQEASIVGAAAEEAIPFLLEHNEGDENHSSPEGSIHEDTDSSEGTFVNLVPEDSDNDTLMVTDDAETIDSDSDSDMESEVTGNDDHLVNDEIETSNIFNPEPSYDDPDDYDEPNIFHGAQVMGVPAQHSIVDLEVYLAEDEDEVQDLPQMELAIDQESYEHYFGTDGAIDLEIVGGRLICTGELFEEDQEITLDDVADDMEVLSLTASDDEQLEAED
ncbi:hypothetical protein FAGAP_7666 [Fusarium agapanthi]|uniref:Uncharacterized protein n=1 Tax=Fusarium agapanthi TaxID=1803897 RepID=A0A9P5ECQ2_9HYPO|nr:hypothetical protein FAGAP_7666 [Fusarium agapanthi]